VDSLVESLLRAVVPDMFEIESIYGFGGEFTELTSSQRESKLKKLEPGVLLRETSREIFGVRQEKIADDEKHQSQNVASYWRLRGVIELWPDFISRGNSWRHTST
jgi:hypothetical protein